MMARLIGVTEWCCPNCFAINKHKFGPRGPYVVECRHSGCGASFAVGMLFHPVTSGFKTPPPDAFMPSERLVEKWRSGRYVNLLKRAALGFPPGT